MTFGRCDSKLVIPCDILADRFVSVLTKKLLNFSAVDFLSVICSLTVAKLLRKESFCNLNFHDFPSMLCYLILGFFKYILEVKIFFECFLIF